MIARGVRFHDLRIKSRLEIPHETIDRRLHLVGDAHGRVYRHAEKEIQQDVQSLRGPHIGHPAEQAPAGEPQQRTVQTLVPEEPVKAYGKRPPAIPIITSRYQNQHDKHQERVKDQAIPRDQGQQIDNQQAKHGLDHADISVKRHPLVCDDGGVIRGTDDIDASGYYRELVREPHRPLPVRGILDVTLQEPQPDSLRQHERQQRYAQMDRDTGREHPPGSLRVTTSQLIVQEPLRGSDHGVIDKREEHHDSPYHIINPEVLYPQYL